MHVKRPDLNPTNFHGLLTQAPEMLALFRLLQRAARSDVTVLIRGESGTGKELAARALHRAGPRSKNAFQAVNCATFTSEMLASQLFGHVKGAYTGAVRNREGLFALADRGTLFLDEVAEIPLELQGRLLRVLQDQSYVPLGGTQERHVDVRIVSATNASLRELVEKRLFREDLMYRLRVVVLRMPPLRERQGDLELLTWAIIDRLNEHDERQIRAISRPAWEAMSAHEWPGNVRELENVLQAAYVLGEGPVLQLDELSPELRGEGHERYSGQPVAQQITLEDRKRQLLLDAWEAHGGRRGEMAKALGMSRSTLYRKLKAHHLT